MIHLFSLHIGCSFPFCWPPKKLLIGLPVVIITEPTNKVQSSYRTRGSTTRRNTHTPLAETEKSGSLFVFLLSMTTRRLSYMPAALIFFFIASALLPTARAYGEPTSGVPTYWERTTGSLLNAARVGSFLSARKTTQSRKK